MWPRCSRASRQLPGQQPLGQQPPVQLPPEHPPLGEQPDGCCRGGCWPGSCCCQEKIQGVVLSACILPWWSSGAHPVPQPQALRCFPSVFLLNDVIYTRYRRSRHKLVTVSARPSCPSGESGLRKSFQVTSYLSNTYEYDTSTSYNDTY